MRRQQIIIPDAFVGGIHPDGDGDVRLQTGIQSYQPPRRTGQCGGVPTKHDGNPQFLIHLEAIRVSSSHAPLRPGFNLLNHRRNNFRVLLAQLAIDFDKTVINPRVVTDEPVGGDQTAETMAERRAGWQVFRLVNQYAAISTVLAQHAAQFFQHFLVGKFPAARQNDSMRR